MLTPVLRKRLLTTANYAVLILMALVALFPIYFMVIASFKNTEDLFRNGIRMVFEFDNLTVANYEYTLTTKDGTIDLKKLNQSNLLEVYDFLANKGVKCYNHLISGAPTSQILSYLVNHKMFDELQSLSDKNNVTMTIYVDDVVFSSEHKISSEFRQSVLSLIKKYNYQVSRKKVKGYSKTYPKLVTGVIINSEGKATIKNALRKKIVVEYEHLRNNPTDTKSRQRLRGLVTAARQVDKSAYPNIRKFAFDSPTKE